MRSIPFSLFVAQITYLLFKPSGLMLSTMAAFAIFFGCLMHLVLDELNAFYLKFAFIPMLKKSSGTAFKLFSDDLWANFFIYSLVLGAMVMIVYG